MKLLVVFILIFYLIRNIHILPPVKLRDFVESAIEIFQYYLITFDNYNERKKYTNKLYRGYNFTKSDEKKLNSEIQ